MSYKSKFTGKQVEALLDKASNIPIYTSQLTNDSEFIDKNNLNKYLDVYSPKDFSKIPIDRDTLYWDNGILKSKVGTSNVDSAFITLNGNEDVSGVKNFLNGIKLSGIELKYDSVNNAVYVQHSDGSPVNFYATGGLSMYGQGKTSVKTIMDAIAANLDQKTLAIENGLLTVIGGTGGGIAEITKQMVIEALGFTPYSAENPNGYITAASIPSALKNPYALTFGSKTYDGSAAKEITASDLGAALSSDLSKYLPLSGGTVTGSSVRPLTINSTNSDNKCFIPFTVNGVIKAYVGYSSAVGALLEVPNGVFRVNTTGITYNGKTVYHAGNFNPANYLPLSGGALTGDLMLKSTSQSSDTPKLYFQRGTTSDGYYDNYIYNKGGGIVFGYSSNGTDYDLIQIGSTFLRPVTDNVINLGTSSLRWANGYFSNLYVNDNAVWHAGNDGSGSGLDADTLDGEHASKLYQVNSAVDLGGTTANYDTLIVRYSNASATSNHPYSIVGGNQCVALNLYAGTDYAAQLAVGFGNNYLAYRRKVGSVSWQSWVKINAGLADEATKLQTARTIWGQSFDGSGNVSGDLSGVGRIIRTEPSAVDMDWAGNFIFKNLNSTSANYWHIDTSDGTPIFVVHNNGKVGIGTTNSSNALYIKTSTDTPLFIEQSYSSSWTSALNAFNSSLIAGQHYNINIGHSASKWNQAWFGYYHAGVGSTSNRLSMGLHSVDDVINILGSGNVGIGTITPSAKLHVVGDILATGGVTMQSQRSLKNVVDERGLSLEELSAIKPTRYTWKDKRDDRIHFGGIADDIQQVLPEVVYKTEEGVLTMDYGNAGFAIASSLIKPVIDHEERIKALERENEMLKQELNRLRA